MKRILLLALMTAACSVVFAQQAQDYFPQQTGYRWDYKVVPLDSANNEIDSMTYFRVDSFAVVTGFMGRNADVVLSKIGPYSLINFLPYTDSSFFSFENTDGYQYYRISNLGNLAALLDSMGLDSSLIGVVQSFEDWYPVYRFGQAVNNEYTIFSKDTTLNINGTNLPLRFEYLGKRLDDETIQTEAGTFTCKKFLLSTVVSYIVFPPIVLEIARLETTSWISEGVWMVQEISPSKTIDLSAVGYGFVNIPGSKTQLITTITDVKDFAGPASDFALGQNYPNPFNPVTNINFRIPEAGNVTLKIYDVLGNEILTLFKGYRSPGVYSVAFNPEQKNLPSGVYIYELKFRGMNLYNKMMYIK